MQGIQNRLERTFIMANSKAVSAIFESHSKAVTSRIARARKDRDMIASWKKRITPLLKLLAFDGTGDNGISIECNWNNSITISMYMENVESFKCDEVGARLWALENWEGLKRQHTHDYASSINRTFTYEYEGGLKVSFNVYVRSDSPTCRRVVVSEEIQTVPTYKIVCD